MEIQISCCPIVFHAKGFFNLNTNTFLNVIVKFFYVHQLAFDGEHFFFAANWIVNNLRGDIYSIFKYVLFLMRKVTLYYY